MSSLIDEYFSLLKKVHEHFDYHENAFLCPLEDKRDMYWVITEKKREATGKRLWCASSEEDLAALVVMREVRSGVLDQASDARIKKMSNYDWHDLGPANDIYRSDDFTMIGVDITGEGDVHMQVFDNSKERSLESLADKTR